jgi:hypothetical protein
MILSRCPSPLQLFPFTLPFLTAKTRFACAGLISTETLSISFIFSQGKEKDMGR